MGWEGRCDVRNRPWEATNKAKCCSTTGVSNGEEPLIGRVQSRGLFTAFDRQRVFLIAQCLCQVCEEKDMHLILMGGSITLQNLPPSGFVVRLSHMRHTHVNNEILETNGRSNPRMLRHKPLLVFSWNFTPLKSTCATVSRDYSGEGAQRALMPATSTDIRKPCEPQERPN